jgi:hypothetical protein
MFLENAVKQGTLLNVYRSQSKSPTRETEEPEGNGGLDEITEIFQEVLSMAENMLDKGSQRGTFLKAFKESLIKKSSEYPFLDPFGGEFEYRDGSIVFTGDAGARDFTRGIGECLRQTNHLEEENPKKNASSEIEGTGRVILGTPSRPSRNWVSFGPGIGLDK